MNGEGHCSVASYRCEIERRCRHFFLPSYRRKSSLMLHWCITTYVDAIGKKLSSSRMPGLEPIEFGLLTGKDWSKPICLGSAITRSYCCLFFGWSMQNHCISTTMNKFECLLVTVGHTPPHTACLFVPLQGYPAWRLSQFILFAIIHVNIYHVDVIMSKVYATWSSYNSCTQFGMVMVET